ncbi:MAG: SDR family NAD(P)-dependent oxidoreductase, partial [Sphingobacteriales bacterium]
MQNTSSPVARMLFLLLWLSTLCSCATRKLSGAAQEKVKGRTYVIIGASSGFGRGVAEQLGAYGANVVLAARRAELLEEVANKVRAAGGMAQVVVTDISRQEEVQRLADSAVRKFGTVDVWINDAGVGAFGRFWEIPVGDQARLIDVNLKGFIYGSHSALRIFQQQGYGTLINLGSTESDVPMAYQASYAASKAGIRSLDEALNQELRLAGQKKIRVVTIKPWAVETPFFAHAANYSGSAPRMHGMEGTSRTVNAIIYASLHPRKKERAVHWRAKWAAWSQRMMPHMNERLSANVVHHYLIKTAPPAPPTPGALHVPVQAGKGVSDN